MKIAILASYPLHFLPEYKDATFVQGHYATWLPQLADHFAHYPELEIYWITLSRQENTSRVIKHNGQEFHILPMIKAGGRLRTLYRTELRMIANCLRDIQPDIVHGWGSEDIYGLAATFFKGPSIVSFQGILNHYFRRIPKFNLHNLAHLFIERIILARAKTVTVESPWGAGVLQSMKPTLKPEIIEYGVHNRYMTIPWQPDPSHPRILFVGTLDSRKGIQDLVAAFAHPSLAGVELLIAGGGNPWSESLKNRSSSNVRWLGYLTGDEISALMSKAWALALPTRADTSPNVVKEARVIGLPVITSPHGGQTRYIEDGKNGFIIECGDIRALVKAITYITSDFERCREMGAWQQAEQREFLAPARTAALFAALYQRIDKERRSQEA